MCGSCDETETNVKISKAANGKGFGCSKVMTVPGEKISCAVMKYL